MALHVIFSTTAAVQTATLHKNASQASHLITRHAAASRTLAVLKIYAGTALHAIRLIIATAHNVKIHASVR
jgi:hypothetical protein